MNAVGWVFGYGSLVSPRSLARTLDRPSAARAALLHGFGRRWNYGSQRLRGDWAHEGVQVRGGVVVALGLAAGDELCNGVVFEVTRTELARLDRRESDYERTDVTAHVDVETGPLDGPVFTYVPRRSAVERYEEARDAGRAAVRRDYWDLVHDAFAAIGATHLELLVATPPPDIPVLDVTLVRS